MNEIRLHPRLLVIEAITMMRNHGVMGLPLYKDTRFVEQVSYEELIAFLDHRENGQNAYYHKLNFDLETALISIRIVRYRRIEKFKRIGAVAALVLLIGIGWLFFQNRLSLQDELSPALALNANKELILTLADGEQIALNDQNKGIAVKDHKLVYEDGTEIEGAVFGDDRTELTLSTPRGKTYRVTLADGTRVWLNAMSAIHFPAEFEEDERNVKLKGEGYFEVAKMRSSSGTDDHIQKMIPFFVESKNQRIEVLGTHFNVSSYEDEKTKTTLLEGSVKVLLSSAKDLPGRTVTLKPGQQSILNGKMPITISTVDPEDAVSWMKGEMVFRNERLKDILLALGHWYDIEVIYQDKAAEELIFGGAITREDNIADALKVFELTGDVRFKVNGKKVIVSMVD
ncbi:FecR family protein [Pedobacter frigoris]|uniref:FecR family protein n=1 Tax=Pedobacter frigoris TaxID=2571272 RepID=UPI0029315E20|nr:FecR domain-containing protein [Pedobacter frigoris]